MKSNTNGFLKDETLMNSTSKHTTLSEHSGNEPAVKIKNQVPKTQGRDENLSLLPNFTISVTFSLPEEELTKAMLFGVNRGK